MKKGIIVVPFMTGFGGTETVIKNLFKERKKNRVKYKLSVYSLGGSIDYSWAADVPLKVKWISKSRFIRRLYYLLGMPLNLFYYLKKERPDFVISTNPVIWFLAKIILPKSVPVIAWYHYSLAQKPIKKVFLYSADFYLAISSGIKRQLENAGISSNKIFTIYNPVVSEGNIVKRPVNEVRFVYLGRLKLDGQKNLRELIDALNNVKGNWKLDLYGDQSDAQELKEYVSAKKIEQHIIWHGFINNPWENMESATALLLTSKYEGLPMVLCEAISHGVYCISANTETGPDDIINDCNGELYQLGNTTELCSILQEVVNGSELPSQKGIVLSAEKFNAHNYLRRFDQVIDKILG